MPGTLDQKKIYAIRSFGLNVIIRFSNEQYNSVGNARIIGRKQKRSDLLQKFHRPSEMEIMSV